MAYSLYVRGRADDELEKLPTQVQDRINAAIDALADDPYPQGSRKLQGREGYRIWVGDYRVLYLVDDQEPSVTRDARCRPPPRGVPPELGMFRKVSGRRRRASYSQS